MDYKHFTQKIINLRDSDLELRDQLVKSGKLFDGYNEEMEQLHTSNAKALDKIIETIGFPTIDKIGKEASEAAWLVIQHSISMPRFMKKCAKLMEQAVADKKANPKHLAYLTDRIAVFEGNPQFYGTQFDWNEKGELCAQSYDDLTKVNLKRKSIGLNTLEEQTAIIRSQAKAENQIAPANYEKKRLEFEDWKKRVGWVK